jgi:hypothetical protein
MRRGQYFVFHLPLGHLVAGLILKRLTQTRVREDGLAGREEKEDTDWRARFLIGRDLSLRRHDPDATKIFMLE